MHLIVYIHNEVRMSPFHESCYEQCEIQDAKQTKQPLQSKKSTGFDIMHPVTFSLLTNDILMPSNRILYLSINVNTISSNMFQILKRHTTKLLLPSKHALNTPTHSTE